MEHQYCIVEMLIAEKTKRGVSSAELARRAEMTAISVRLIMRHKRALQADELVRLCAALEIPLSRFATNVKRKEN